MNMEFPKNFLWGAATSAYQIEGAVNEDGRGKSIWDVINHSSDGQPIGDTGDIACDHYHRYKEDIVLMKNLGLKTYRFSISWTRIYPEEKGRVNHKGITFYNSLINELLHNNIEPIITTWHSDLPLVFEQVGGWRNQEIIEYYIDYVSLLFNTYGDRVKKWITHNEPWCTAFLGDKQFNESLLIAHNLLVAHGKAVQAYKNSKYGNGKIGVTLNLCPNYPGSELEIDLQAAYRGDGYINRWFLDPIFLGKYPQDMKKIYQKKGYFKNIDENELEVVKQYSSDFLGINYYTRSVVKHVEDESVLQNKEIKIEDSHFTEMDWEVYPRGLYDLLTRIDREYNHPNIMITENGAAYKDNQIIDNRVEDNDRISYLQAHIKQLYLAIQAGVKVDAYYVWSLLDNFEWGLGYSKRFGIIRVDYHTQQRTFKKSAEWYKKVIVQNGLFDQKEFSYE